MIVDKILRTRNKRGSSGTTLILGGAVLIALMIFVGPLVLSHMGGGEDGGIDRALPIKINSVDTCDATAVNDKVAIWSGDGSRLLETLTPSSGVATSTHNYMSGEVVDIYGYSATDASYYDYYMNDVKIPKAPNDQVSYHQINEDIFLTDAISEANLALYSYAAGALVCDESSAADWDVDGSDDQVMTIAIDTSAGTGDGLGRYIDLRGDSVCWDPIEKEMDFVIFGLRFNSTGGKAVTASSDASYVGCDTDSFTKVAVSNEMIYYLMKLPRFVGQSATYSWNGLFSITIQLDFASLSADTTSMAVVLYDNADWNNLISGAPTGDGDGVADDNTAFTGSEIG